jgi:protein TonB
VISTRTFSLLASIGCHAVLFLCVPSLFHASRNAPDAKTVHPEIAILSEDPHDLITEISPEEPAPATLEAAVPAVPPTPEPIAKPIIPEPTPSPAPPKPPEPKPILPVRPALTAKEFVAKFTNTPPPTPPAPKPVAKVPSPLRQFAVNSAPASSSPSKAASTNVAVAISTPVAGRTTQAIASTGSDYQAVSSASFRKRADLKYPTRAQRANQEGLTLLTVYLNESGKADKVEVTESSGFPLLDEAAVKFARESIFNPAFVGNSPIRSKVELPVRFGLKK